MLPCSILAKPSSRLNSILLLWNTNTKSLLGLHTLGGVEQNVRSVVACVDENETLLHELLHPVTGIRFADVYEKGTPNYLFSILN